MPPWTRSSTVSTPRSATRSPAAPRPLAILAGAGSGKTRVLTRRIAWQSPRGPRRSRPTCSRSPSPARPPASCGRASPVSGSASRSPPARSTPSRSPSCGAGPTSRAARCPALLERKVRVLAAAAPVAGPGGRAARRRARLRDRVGQGPAGQARRLRARGRRRRAHHAASARRGRRRLPRLRAREAQARARRLRRPHHRVRRRARTRRRVRRRATLAVPPPLRRRVPGRRAPRSSACSGRGSATAATCAWSAIPTRRSTGSPAPTRPTWPASAAGSRPSSSPTSGSSASAATTARRRRSSRPPSAVLGPPGVAVTGVHAAQPDGPLPEFHRVRHRRRRSARRRPGDCATPRARDLPWSRMAVLYRVNAQSALFEEALRPCRACRSACAAAVASSTAPR